MKGAQNWTRKIHTKPHKIIADFFFHKKTKVGYVFGNSDYVSPRVTKYALHLRGGR